MSKQTKPFEDGMLLLVQDDDDIAGLEFRLLIALAVKDDLLTVGHSLVDVYLEDLPVADDLFALALLASIGGVDALALAATVRADGLDLLDQTCKIKTGGRVRQDYSELVV